MHKSRLSLLFLGFLFACLVTVANAQATRTWVSGVGDDVNPCSRTAPCKTFAGAISKTAASGEINCLDPAGFGAVTITKSMTIDCKGTIGGILSAGTNGVIVNSATAVVRLRGLDINGAGTGINGVRVLAAFAVYVEDTVIDGVTASGISIEGSGQVIVKGSTICNNAVGVNVTAPSGSVEIILSDSLIAGNVTGVNVGPNTTVRIDGNVITANKTGLANKGGAIISFRNNAIEGNGTNGAPTSTIALQ